MRVATWSLLIVLGSALVACGNEPLENSHSGPSDNLLLKLVNKFALKKREAGFDGHKLDPVLIGEAVPANVDSLELSSGLQKSVILEKSASSLVGSELFHIEYKISFLYQVKFLGKGSYLQNVKFTPLNFKIDPTITVLCQITSEEPINIAEQGDDPEARLSFSLTWQVNSILGFTEARTDEFWLDGAGGTLESVIRDF